MAPLTTVQLGDLTVTMAPVEDLRAEAARRAEAAADLVISASKLRADAISMLVEAGMILVARTGEWASSQPDAVMPLEDAARMIRVIDEKDGGLSGVAASSRSGLAALFSRKQKAPEESPEARQAREERGAQLRVVLSELGRSYGAVLPSVASSQAKALNQEQQAASDRERARNLEDDARELRVEAARREAGIAALGFDAVHTAAQMELTPPAPVTSPLVLRGQEMALLAEAAQLGRLKAPAGGEPQGLRFPVEQTGIPYAVGSYRGQPIAQDGWQKFGPGTFVVTNQRLGFVGKLKSFSFPVSDLVRVEQFSDGLTLLREGRDHADVLLTPSASRVLFYINWVLRPRG
ncbi:MAG TPA: hypothetical protein VIN56_05725 [Candidatus Dormibacteraeota bacterium]|jgi:hypothetical protein